MAVTHEQATTSTEFVRMAVSATEEGELLDITANAVTVLFSIEGTDPPAAGSVSWVAATWETDPTTTPDTYYARALVGPSPGVVQLTPGIWDVWVKIVDAPEVTIRKADGQVRII